MSQAADAGVCPNCGKEAGRALSRFACMAKDDTGYTAPLGGSSCGG
jgi:hypothetical protein